MTSTQRSFAVALWALMVVSLLGLVAMMRWQSQVEAARTRDVENAVAITASQSTPDVNQIAPLELRAPAFKLTDQDGKPFDSATLRGKVYTVSFFFSQCQGVCPGMVGRIHELQRAIPDPDIHNVYLTVDPERDTPERLHAYGQTVKADPSHWHLLTGTSEQMHKVAADFGKGYDTPSNHSAAIILVDRAGKIVGFYESRHPEEMLRLADDARRVLADKSTDKPATQPTDSVAKAGGDAR